MNNLKKFAIVFGLLGLLFAWFFTDNFKPEVLKGKRVVVTGASTGIGEQIAYQYARFGAKVVVVARREEELKKVVSTCLQLGAPEAHYIIADLSTLEAAKRLHEESLRLLKGVDIVVLNHVKPFSEYWGSNSDLAKVTKLFAVNTISYIHIATLFLPELQASNGSLIVVSSLTGIMGFWRETCYSSNKHALHGFFDSLRQELQIQRHSGSPSITLCVLGPVDTENAKLHYQGSVDIFWYPADDCALAIVKGGALRQRQIYFPAFLKLLELLHFHFPGFIEAILPVVSKQVPLSEVNIFPFNLL